MPATIVSAPGKVLLAGGYLVLDPTYSGLVVATSSRFFTIVSDVASTTASSTTSPSLPTVNAGESTASTNYVRIIVRAGQFPREHSEWVYHLAKDPNGQGISIQQQNKDKGTNKFIEITLAKAIQVAWEVIMLRYRVDEVDNGANVGNVDEANTLDRAGEELMKLLRGAGNGLEVVVLADNDFYSQREQLTAASLPPLISSLAQLTPFHLLPRPISQTNKTGLGSSAALVTSLTAGILGHLGVVSIPNAEESEAMHNPDSNESTTGLTGGHDGKNQSGMSQPRHGLELVHSLAQLSHCIAQGKVGSGFDVSSAVFGTHIYRRFSPSILAPLMSSSAPSNPFVDTSTIRPSDLLSGFDPATWDHSTLPFRLPDGLRLLLADVDAGTDTPSFVGKVLRWRENERGVADELWRNLSKANGVLGDLLRDMAKKEGEEGYEQELKDAARMKIEECEIALPTTQLLVRIRAALILIRSYLQHMSTLSGVPIEPAEQTRLLDACSAVPGVLGGGVPGAGGYDAIFLLIIDRPSVLTAVEQVWSTWTELSVCPLSARQSDGGLRLERMDNVVGLKEALTR